MCNVYFTCRHDRYVTFHWMASSQIIIAIFTSDTCIRIPAHTQTFISTRVIKFAHVSSVWNEVWLVYTCHKSLHARSCALIKNVQGNCHMLGIPIDTDQQKNTCQYHSIWSNILRALNESAAGSSAATDESAVAWCCAVGPSRHIKQSNKIDRNPHVHTRLIALDTWRHTTALDSQEPAWDNNQTFQRCVLSHAKHMRWRSAAFKHSVWDYCRMQHARKKCKNIKHETMRGMEQIHVACLDFTIYLVTTMTTMSDTIERHISES